MAKKHFKSEKYPGVYWREIPSPSRPGKTERSYFVRYKKDGKLIEAKVGLQFRDDMTEARAAKQRSLLIEGKAQTRTEQRQAEKAKLEAENSRMTMSKLWDHFKVEKNSLKSFGDDQTRWTMYIKPTLGDMDPANMTRDNIKAILEKMDKEGKSLATQRQVYTQIKRMVNLGAYDGLCSPLNFKIKMPKLNNARERYLSKDEAQRLLDTLKANKKGKQTYYITLLSLNTGARFGEIARLKWGDVNLEQQSIFVGDSKNGYARTLYMNDPVYEMFLTLDRGQPQDLVFPAKTGKVMHQISKLFYRTLDALGLNHGIDDPRQKICFHSLRHTFASWAVIEGCDIYRLKEVLGHKSIEMTMRYAHLAPDAGRQVVNMVGGYQSGKVVSLDQARKEKQAAVNE